MKKNNLYRFIVLTIMIALTATSSYAIEPFLNGITNGEVLHMVFSEEGNLFIAIKNNSNTIVYNQSSYSVTKDNISLMKISTDKDVEWVKDLSSEITYNLENFENYKYGAPAVIGMEITSDKLYIVVNFDSGSYGARCIVYNHDGTKQKTLYIGDSGFTGKNISLNADDKVLVAGDKKYYKSQSGSSHYYWRTDLRRLDMSAPSTEFSKNDNLSVQKSKYDRSGDDNGTFDYVNKTLYINIGAAAIVSDDSGNIYTISRQSYFKHGNSNTYSKPEDGIVRNWDLDISTNSISVFSGSSTVHDQFYDKEWKYFVINNGSNNDWAGCELHANFNCSWNEDRGGHINWYTNPSLYNGDDGHYNRNDGLFYVDSSEEYKFIFANIDDYVRLIVDGDILIEQKKNSDSTSTARQK